MLPLPDPELLAQIVEYLPDALVVVNRASTIVLANRQTEMLFGRPRAALLGQPIEVLIPEEFRERHRDHFHSYSTNPQVRPMGVGLHLEALTSDGDKVPVDINLSPLVTSEGTFFAAVIRKKRQ